MCGGVVVWWCGCVVVVVVWWWGGCGDVVMWYCGGVLVCWCGGVVEGDVYAGSPFQCGAHAGNEWFVWVRQEGWNAYFDEIDAVYRAAGQRAPFGNDVLLKVSGQRMT